MQNDFDQPSCVLEAPYLLAINAPLHQGADGSYYADPRWAKDLLVHARHHRHLVYLAPVLGDTNVAGMTLIPHDAMRVVGYRVGGGNRGFLLAIPRLILLLFREVPHVAMVQTCVDGPPVPVGWFAGPIARLYGKKVGIIVEAAFWRIHQGSRASLLRRAKEKIWERIARRLIRHAEYAAYTTAEYQQTLPSTCPGGGRLFHPSWLDEAMLCPLSDVDGGWNARIASNVPPRYLFAARMVLEKGTAVLAEAITLLEKRSFAGFIDVIGTGPEVARFKALRRSDWAREHLSVLEEVSYGEAFFSLLRRYDAVLVPSLTNEQPRIVFDAGSQGVGSIASNTPGLIECVEDGISGRIVPAGDAAALADAIEAASRDRAIPQGWGSAARIAAAGLTHAGVAEERCRDVHKAMQGSAG